MNMKRILSIATVLLLGLGTAGSAGAVNLVLNGDFELLDDRVGYRGYALDNLAPNRWDVYDALPGGWQSAPGGSGIEVQHNTVVPANSPHHYVELDSHSWDGGPSNSSMFQWIHIADPGTYELSFFYRARTNNRDDNGIDVFFDDLLVADVDGFKYEFTDWEQYVVTFDVAQAGDYDLMFSAVGNDNSLGGFLDDISMASVPEPATMILFGSGLVGLVALARKKNKK
jgi:hypothetical protein